jgi:hypothetical protein
MTDRLFECPGCGIDCGDEPHKPDCPWSAARTFADEMTLDPELEQELRAAAERYREASDRAGDAETWDDANSIFRAASATMLRDIEAAIIRKMLAPVVQGLADQLGIGKASR